MNSLGNFDVNRFSHDNPQMADKQLNQGGAQIRGSRMQKALAPSTPISRTQTSNPDNKGEKKATGRSLFAKAWAHLPGGSVTAEKVVNRAVANQLKDALQEALNFLEKAPDVK